MTIESFKKHIKTERTKKITKPRTLVEIVVKESSFYDEDKDYYLKECTKILHTIRDECWNRYRKMEKELTADISDYLISNDASIYINFDQESPDARTIISNFLANYDEHLFELSKSHTNSRRSRAGKEFEAIIEVILLRSGVIFDNQGIIGSRLFKTDSLGKLVDCVVPGVAEYTEEKRRCALVSMKTTLRERWQEVAEEMQRTGANEMFLVTLDKHVTKSTIENLGSHNITLVVPDNLKESNYKDYNTVYSLSELISELLDRTELWKSRKGLSKGFYEKRIITLEKRLENINVDYVREQFLEYKSHCEDQIH